ncbi:hypothetical protein [Bacteroides sp. Ga6A1]|nr:hypothetical protein [Bacteroides sp. Ga6A1]
MTYFTYDLKIIKSQLANAGASFVITVSISLTDEHYRTTNLLQKNFF